MKVKLAMFIDQGDGELSLGTMLRQAMSSPEQEVMEVIKKKIGSTSGMTKAWPIVQTAKRQQFYTILAQKWKHEQV